MVAEFEEILSRVVHVAKTVCKRVIDYNLETARNDTYINAPLSLPHSTTRSTRRVY